MVISAVSSLPRTPTKSEVMLTVGASASVLTGTVKDAAKLSLPDKSEKSPACRDMTAAVSELLSGVKIALYVVPEPVKLPNVPPDMLNSTSLKSGEASERSKLMVTSPVISSESAEISTLGEVVSTTSREKAFSKAPPSSSVVDKRTL